jgi:hypothetical protein
MPSVEDQNISIPPPTPARHPIHGIHPNCVFDNLRDSSWCTALKDYERGSVILHSAVIVSKLENQETHVLCDGTPIDFIDGALVRDSTREHTK